MLPMLTVRATMSTHIVQTPVPRLAAEAGVNLGSEVSTELRLLLLEVSEGGQDVLGRRTGVSV
jgi:hypothetical protein